MAPIEPYIGRSTLIFAGSLGSFITTITGLTALICNDVLYKSYKALPPSQDTRHRQFNREKHIRLFSVLACLSFMTSIYHAFLYVDLSYRSWEHEMGHEVLLRILGWEAASHSHFGRWYQDTNLLWDAWEIVIERSRRYWWTQQSLLGTGLWSIYVGIEGRRRHIRHLWAFLVLAQVFSPSFAMNLFFLAVLLTPIPLPPRESTAGVHTGSVSTSNIKNSNIASRLPTSAIEALESLLQFLPPLPTRPHPVLWTPSPYALLPSILTLQICTFLLPYATSTPQFLPFLLVPHIAAYRLAYMDRVTPPAYGSFTKSKRNYIFVYRTASFVSLLLHFKSTFTALLDNDPGAYSSSHPHSAYLAALHLPHETERTTLVRSTLSFTRVLTSLNEHPVVAVIGWDVLLASFSLACWAVSRGLDVRKILYASAIIHLKPPELEDKALASAIVVSSPKNRRRKWKSTISPLTSDDNGPMAQPEPGENDVATKEDSTFQASSSRSSIPRGEEEEEENLEGGAVGGALFVLGGLGVLAAGVLGADSA